ncbi:hypothetical protein ACVWXN_008546 [Bradyrhizobium sp. i1.4.4]
MSKPKITLAGLRADIDDGLRELKTDAHGPHAEALWEMLSRYLQEPDNHLVKLFEKAGLDKDNVKHLQAVLWTVSAPLYHRGTPWHHVANVELLMRATLARAVLELADQPRDIRDICVVLTTSHQHLGTISRDAVNRVLKELNFKKKFWEMAYEDIDPESLETRLYVTLSDYERFMANEVRDRCSAEEIEQIESALDCFRPAWRSK